MSDNYRPPKHDLLRVVDMGLACGPHIRVGLEGGNYFLGFTPEEAISLGLALMETGLFLKQQQKERTNG